VSVGQDINHLVAVWSTDSGTWQDGKLQAYSMGGQAKLLFATFISPVMRFQLMTGGVSHVTFWTLNNRRLMPTPGKFGKKGRLQPVMCGATVDKYIVTGTVSGHIYVWDMEGPTVVRSIKAHSKTINTMYSRSTIGAGTVLLTGSKDGIIKLWNHNLLCQKSFDAREGRPAPRVPAVRSVCIDAFGNSVLIGTQGSEIYEVSNIFATAQVTHSTMLVQGHFGGDELWGLAPHPTNPDLYATVGDDAMLRVWSISKRRLDRELALETIARAVAWSPDGKTIGVGLGGTTRRGRSKKDGAFLIIDAKSLSVQYEGRDSREWISDCKFSPDGRIFAIGSRDSKVYLYDVQDSYILKAKCEKFSSYVTHIDFSANSAYIQGNSGAYELIFYNSSDGQQLLSASSVKDEAWDTQTCVLGWSVQGLWPEVFDGNDINAAHLAKRRKMIASVDEFGQFKVVKNPALDKRADAAIGYGHSRHCTNVRWNEDENFVMTTGGSDRTVMQWRVHDKKIITTKQLAIDDSGDGKKKKKKKKRR
jgi:microtubule-associated protein-like 6